jgi:hypothetical protein
VVLYAEMTYASEQEQRGAPLESAESKGPKLDADQEEFLTFFRTQARVRNEGPGNTVYLYLDNLDQKTSALLTHVSLIMAVATLLFTNVPAKTPWKFVAGVEVVLYMAIGLGCLTCVDILTPESVKVKTDPWSDDNPNVLLGKSISTAMRRLRVYRACHISTIVLTIVLIVTFLARLLS